MKKLTLQIEQLAVDSFVVDAHEAVRGTVRGLSGHVSGYSDCGGDSDHWCSAEPSAVGCGGEPWNPGASLITCNMAATCPTNEGQVNA